MTIEQNAADNQSNMTPEQGQVEDSTRTREDVMNDLGNIGEEQQAEVEGQEAQEQPTEETTEKIVVGDKEFDSIEEFKNEYQQTQESYSELRKRLSQRSEKEKNFEEMQQFLQKNKEAAKAMQLAAQDPNFQAMLQAYENGMVNQEQLQKLRQYMGQQMQQQQQSQQQQFDPQQFQQQVQQEMQSQMMAFQAKQQMQNDFEQLKNQYSDVINENNIDFENLAEYGIKHGLMDEQGQKVDMQRALNHYVADNQDIFQMMQKAAQNQVQKNQQQKKQAQVEQSSLKGQQNTDNNEKDQMIQDILNAPGGGGGVL